MGDAVLSGSITAVHVVESLCTVQYSCRKIGAWAPKLLIFEPCSIQLSIFYLHYSLFIQEMKMMLPHPIRGRGAVTSLWNSEIHNFPYVDEK